MDDELEIFEEEEQKLEENNRYKKLSEKVINASKERDEAAQAKEEALAAKAQAEKERDFFKGFNEISSKYSGASEFQDQILEKVNKGYDLEDAALAILAKEGRLGTQVDDTGGQPDSSPEPLAVPTPPTQDIAGGSAPTITPGAKAIGDMTAEEKLAALSELGDSAIANALKRQ